MVERKYVDVDVFAYWLGSHPVFGEKAYRWIKSIERARRGEYITSTLTLYELAVVIAGLKGAFLRDRDFIETIVRALISLQGLEIVSLELQDHVKALELMNSYRLDYEDALHLAVAIRVNAKKIISNDSDYDRTPIERVF